MVFHPRHVGVLPTCPWLCLLPGFAARLMLLPAGGATSLQPACASLEAVNSPQISGTKPASQSASTLLGTPFSSLQNLLLPPCSLPVPTLGNFCTPWQPPWPGTLTSLSGPGPASPRCRPSAASHGFTQTSLAGRTQPPPDLGLPSRAGTFSLPQSPACKMQNF